MKPIRTVKYWAALAWLLAASLTACGSKPETTAKLAEETEALRADLKTLRTEFDVLSQVYSDRIMALEANDGVTAAALTIGEGYGAARTEIGAIFLVSWDDSKPQGDGTVASLQIGNPYSADFTGMTISASYYKGGDPNAKNLIDRFPKPAGKYETRSTENIKAGRWNRVSIRIPGVKPEEISRLEITLRPDVVSLIRPR